jgi:outer membrane lipoprotein-sorting protein
MIVVFSGGCGAKLTKKERPGETQILTVSEILSELKSRYDLVDTLKTWMNVTIRSEGQKYEVRELLYYKRPDKLRVQAMGPLNEPRAIVLASDQKLTIFFVQEKEARIGDLSDETLKQIFDIDVRISDIKSAIFANPFLDSKTDSDQVSQIKLSRESEGYKLSRSREKENKENYTEEIVVSPKQITVKGWRLVDSKGEVLQQTSFSDYREIGGVIRPLKVVIERFDKPVYLSFESVKPQINLDLSDSLFSMPLPEGTKILPIEDR